MELYKLYCILKHHTGYDTMLETMRRGLMPWVYEERRKRAEFIMAQASLMKALSNAEGW